MDCVIGLAGPIASTKASISQELAERLGVDWVSFGNLVREEARRRGVDEDPSSLQDLGDRLIEEFGWDRFCQKVIDQSPKWQPGKPLVVDGIRHVDAVVSLAKMTKPGAMRVFYIQPSLEMQRRNLEERGVSNPVEIGRLIENKNEAEAGLVRSFADVVVTPTSPPETAARIEDLLRTKGFVEFNDAIGEITRNSDLTLEELTPILHRDGDNDGNKPSLTALWRVVQLLSPGLPPSSLHQWLTSPKPDLNGESVLDVLGNPASGPQAALDSAKRFVEQG